MSRSLRIITIAPRFSLNSNYFLGLHRSTKYEVVIVTEIPKVISEVIFGAETESGLRIAPSRQFFE